MSVYCLLFVIIVSFLRHDLRTVVHAYLLPVVFYYTTPAAGGTRSIYRRTAEPHSAISQSIVATIPSCLCITFLDYLLNRRQPLQVPNTLLRYMFRCYRSFVLVIGSH